MHCTLHRKEVPAAAATRRSMRTLRRGMSAQREQNLTRWLGPIPRARATVRRDIFYGTLRGRGSYVAIRSRVTPSQIGMTRRRCGLLPTALLERSHRWMPADRRERLGVARGSQPFCCGSMSSFTILLSWPPTSAFRHANFIASGGSRTIAFSTSIARWISHCRRYSWIRILRLGFFPAPPGWPIPVRRRPRGRFLMTSRGAAATTQRAAKRSHDLRKSKRSTDRLDAARVNLAAASSVLAAAALPADERRRLQDMHNAVELCLRWFAEGPTAVNRDRADCVAAGSTGSSGDVRATLVRAAAFIRSGESGQAAQLLHRFGQDAAANGAEAAVDFLTLRAELADFNAEAPHVSEHFLAGAIDIARANGLGGRELYAKHQLFSARWMHSRSASDRDAYRRLVDRADRSLPPRLRSSLAFCSADIEVAIGHPQRALRSAEEAGAVSTNVYERLSARGLVAGALLRLGRVTDAGLQAAAAAEPARLAGHARVLSLAQRISAQAYLAQGNRRAARCAIEEALECARRFSSAHVLRQAQSVLGRVTAR